MDVFERNEGSPVTKTRSSVRRRFRVAVAFGCFTAMTFALASAFSNAVAAGDPPRAAVGAADEATKYFDAFLQNFQQITTCEIEITGFASSYDRSIASDYYRLLKRDDSIRLDHVHRRIGPNGVENETLSRRYFDGRRTIRVDVSFPGIEREYWLGDPKGIRASIVDRCDLPFPQSLMDCISFWTISLGDILTFDRALEAASDIQLIDPSGPTVRLVLPDRERSSGVVSQRQIDFDFDRQHGFWPTEVRYRSQAANGQAVVQRRGRMVVEGFLDLGHGRFFPKRMDLSTQDEAGHRQQHPIHVVTKCRINQTIGADAIELEVPCAVPVLVQPAQIGQVVKHSAQVRGADGETREFSQESELDAFAKTVKGSPQWSAKYTPPSGFPYHFKTPDEVRAKGRGLEGSGIENVGEPMPSLARRSIRAYAWIGGAAVVSLLGVLLLVVALRIRRARD